VWVNHWILSEKRKEGLPGTHTRAAIIMEDDDKQGRLQNVCQYVVTIELDTLAVLAKQAMSAKTRS